MNGRAGRAGPWGLLATVALAAGLTVLVPAGAAAPATPPPAKLSLPTPIHHVMVIFFENAELNTTLAQGPFERSLAGRFATAGEYFSPGHYSLPNYLAATSGIWTNRFAVNSTANVGSLATAAGENWNAFEESMPTPCDRSSGGNYTIYHDPFVMYQSVVHRAAYCDRHVVNLTGFSVDLAAGRLPAYSFVTPNLLDDGHNTNVSCADHWLAGFLGPVMNSSSFNSTVVFITYDEGTTNASAQNASSGGGGHIYFAAVSPWARRNYSSPVDYTPYNLLTTTEWLLGLGRTGHHDNWTTTPPMRDLFNFSQKIHHGSALAGPANPPAPGGPTAAPVPRAGPGAREPRARVR